MPDVRFNARTLADSLPEMLWMAQPDGSADFFNAAWSDATGLGPAESGGMGWLDAIHADDVQNVVTRWERATATGAPFDVHCRLRVRGGSYRLMHARAAALKAAGDKITGWNGTFVDVHDRAEDAARAKHAEFLYRSLLEQLPANVWTARAGGDIDHVSPGWTTLSGWPAEAALDEAWIDLIHPDDRERMAQLWKTSVETGVPYSVVFRYYNRRLGFYEWALNKAVAVRNTDGSIIQWLGTTTDFQQRCSNAAAFRFLTDVGAASNRRREAYFDGIVAAAVGKFADAAIVKVLSPDGKWSDAASGGDGEIVDALRALTHVKRADGLVARAIRTGVPIVLESPSAPVRSLICAAVEEAPKLCVMLFGRGAATAPYDRNDLDVVSEVAARTRECAFA